MHVSYTYNIYVINNSVAMYEDIKPYTLVELEPVIFCSGGSSDNHYAKSQGLWQNKFDKDIDVCR
jgi:hypothetical protein